MRPRSPAFPTVFIVATVADQLSVQYREHVQLLVELGSEVHVYASAHPDYLLQNDRVRCHVIPIKRMLDPFGAARAIALLMQETRRRRPTLVLYGSPSAALVGSLASRLFVPHRVLVVHGLREETLSGVKRFAAVMAGRLSARLSTLVIFVSPSVAEQSGYARSRRSSRRVVAPGGFVGARVVPVSWPEVTGAVPEVLTIGFIGRLARDKGVEELVAAVHRLREKAPLLRLLLVGNKDVTDPLADRATRAISEDGATTWTGQVDDANAYLDQMDVLCLPSYREGLPTVVLEAMAHGIAVVGSDATGVRDVVSTATGWPCEAGSVDSLTAALRAALADPQERQRRAQAAYEVVRARYSTDVVMRWWREQYEALLGQARPLGHPLVL